MNRTFLSLAEEVGLHEKTVRRIFHAYTQELEQATHIATPRGYVAALPGGRAPVLTTSDYRDR